MIEFRLTKREAEVICYTANGKTLEEVAMILGISRNTVKTHIFNARLRLDATNLMQLVALSITKGLISMNMNSVRT